MRKKVCCGQFNVCQKEEKDYSFFLANGQDEKIGLYGVIVESPFLTKKVYVLADSGENAIGQALCVLKLSPYAISEALNRQITTHAERLPMAIQGWGKTQF